LERVVNKMEIKVVNTTEEPLTFRGQTIYPAGEYIIPHEHEDVFLNDPTTKSALQAGDIAVYQEGILLSPSEINMYSVINAAMKFGKELLVKFAAGNVLLGITQAGMTGSVRKTMLQVISAVETGSLYDAISEAKAIPLEAKDEVFITDARILDFVNRIEAYLGIPLSESL